MVDSATIQQLVDYYTNLLIIQYNNKTKARATIALFVKELLASAVILDVQNAYSLSDDNPAVGPQLDVLGKYAGVDRYYSQLNLIDYSALVSYDEAGSLPDSPPAYGLGTYATFSADNFNGTLQYSEILIENNALTDPNFLLLIRFAIICNNGNFSVKQIDDELFKFFGTDVRREADGVMRVVYFVNASVSPLIHAVIYKKLLPVPMAVGFLVVTGVRGLMFGMVDYATSESPYEHGLCAYADFDSVEGQCLMYSQITPG